MPYTYRFYKFDSHTEFAARWAEAGLLLDEDGAPILPSGAIDEIGSISSPGETEDEPITLPGWHVNVAWAGAAPGALEAFSIEPFEGLRVFAGWSDPQPPAPVPETVSFAQAEIMLASLPGPGSIGTALEAVEAWVTTQDFAIQTLWRRGYELNRYSPNVALIGQMLGVDLDWFFREADKISG